LKFLGYVGTNAEQLCAEFCNFVQCHAFVNYLLVNVKFNATVFNWYDNGINSDVAISFHSLLNKGVLNITDTNMVAKNTRCYTGL